MKRYAWLCGALILCLLLASCSTLDNTGTEIPRWESTTAPTEERMRVLTEEDPADVFPDQDGDIIYIREKMFITQTNEIYLNANDYLGKTLRYEGFFGVYQDEFTAESGGSVCCVIRNGPGCCPGVDNTAGFEVVWESDSITTPAENDWVEVTGVLEQYDVNGWQYLRLRLSALEVLPVRGADYVEQ